MSPAAPALMKKIGLIGGIGFPSTLTYYRRLNELVNQRLGRSHSARLVLESLDFQPIAQMLVRGDGAAIAAELLAASQRLVDAGAEMVAMCCNTVHKYATAVEYGIDVPLINMCRCTAREADRQGARTVALMGSAFSMEESFYRSEFARQGLDMKVPGRADRAFIQHAIETELTVGRVSEATRERFVRIARELCESGADALVLACTEIPLVIDPCDVDMPVLDTVEIHCAAIVLQALGAEPVNARRSACGSPT
ncbi:MAG: amino acid racemase [Comamonadaceae bacterium]|nr:MAG: amino acid racemase [Comamonadaceae bacterium]